jgi:hypothetical protein
LTVAHLRVSLTLSFSALFPRWLIVATPRFPLCRVAGLPIAVSLASISLIAVEVALGRLGTVRNWCTLGKGRLTVGYGCVVTIVPIIASTACCRPVFAGLLTVIGTAANAELGALAKFQARGLR